MSSSEADLLAAARTSDAAAFEVLLRPLIEPAYRLAYTMLRNRNEAEDAVQEVWVKLLPAGSNLNNFQTAELHRYDVAAARDRRLWSYAGSIILQQWNTDGILINTVPPAGGQATPARRWLPAPIAGTPNSYVYVNPAGQCF